MGKPSAKSTSNLRANCCFVVELVFVDNVDGSKTFVSSVPLNDLHLDEINEFKRPLKKILKKLFFVNFKLNFVYNIKILPPKFFLRSSFNVLKKNIIKNDCFTGIVL